RVALNGMRKPAAANNRSETINKSPLMIPSLSISRHYRFTPGNPIRTPATLALWAAVLVLAAPGSSRATDLLTTNVQGAGANWTAAIWKTNNGSLVPTGTAVSPIPGNTYQEIFNGTFVSNGAACTRIRPPTSGNATFP